MYFPVVLFYTYMLLLACEQYLGVDPAGCFKIFCIFYEKFHSFYYQVESGAYIVLNPFSERTNFLHIQLQLSTWGRKELCMPLPLKKIAWLVAMTKKSK